MKKSSRVSLLFVSAYIIGAVICDFVLAAKYRSTDLENPMKNFARVAVKPFTHLQITGGNGYAIEIKEGTDYNIMLMNSRKSFFTAQSSMDTLKLEFNVANQTYQDPKNCIVGLIISVPNIKRLLLRGTNNIIGPYRGDSLDIIQQDRTFTRLRNTEIDHLSVNVQQESVMDFESGNTARYFSPRMENKGSVIMNGISFEYFSPIVKDSAKLIFFGNALEKSRQTNGRH